MRAFFIVPVLFLAACAADTPSPKISRAEDAPVPALSYGEFRALAIHDGDDLSLVQKRFIMLDRDNNGRLTQNEYSAY